MACEDCVKVASHHVLIRSGCPMIGSVRSQWLNKSVLGRSVRELLCPVERSRSRQIGDGASPGTFWDGEPIGKEITHKGLEAYISEPEAKISKGILIIPDIFGSRTYIYVEDILSNFSTGWQGKNTRLLADKWASQGFLTVLPDFFAGDPPPLKARAAGDQDTFLAWIKKNGPEKVLPNADKYLDYLHSQGVTSVGVATFCWGGKHGVRLAGTDKVKALIVNHGSWITEDDVKSLKQPSLWNGSENDKQIPKDLFYTFEKIVKGNNIPTDFKFFEGATHGWTVRGDNNDPELAKKIEDAFNRSSQWFNKYL